jgi:MSHA biogenesis protein MshI
VRWLPFLNRKRRSDVRAGVAASEDAVAIAVVRRAAGQRPEILHYAEEPAMLGYADPALRRLLRDFDLGKTPVSAVIGANDYQLAQIAAPEVPEAEMRAAARWRMREVIDFALDDATVDVFDVPAKRDRQVRRTLFSVASRGDVPQFIAMSLSRLTDHLDVIDIPELCQRNLSALRPEDHKGVAFILMRNDYAQLVLTRAGLLYVARRLEYDRGSSDTIAGPDGAAPAIDANAFALELQRSLDYYETHFDQAPIGDVVVAPATALDPALASEITAQTGLRVHALKLEEHLELPAQTNAPTGWLATLAIGAALRSDAAGH